MEFVLAQSKGKKRYDPSKINRRAERPYNQELYKTRHLIENFFCRFKRYHCHRNSL